MSELYEQILSIVFSIIYGLILSNIFKKLKKYTYNLSKIYLFFNIFLFFNIIVFIYYKVMYYINRGSINLYYIIITFIAFLIYSKILTKKMSK